MKYTLESIEGQKLKKMIRDSGVWDLESSLKMQSIENREHKAVKIDTQYKDINIEEIIGGEFGVELWGHLISNDYNIDFAYRYSDNMMFLNNQDLIYMLVERFGRSDFEISGWLYDEQDNLLSKEFVYDLLIKLREVVFYVEDNYVIGENKSKCAEQKSIILNKVCKSNEGVYHDDLIKDLTGEEYTLSNAALSDIKIDNNLYSYGYAVGRDEEFRNVLMTNLKTRFNLNRATKAMMHFIDCATYWFDRDHHLNNIDLIVYPDSDKSDLNRQIIRSFNNLLMSGNNLVSHQSIDNLCDGEVINKTMNAKSVLIVDVILTNNSVVLSTIKNIRRLNTKCSIYVFSLIKSFDGNADRYVQH